MGTVPLSVLQLVDVDAGYQATRGAVMLERGVGEGVELHSVTVGRGGALPSVLSAVAAVRRRSGVEVVHAVGPRSLTVAALGSRVPVVYTPSDGLPKREAHWLRRVMNYRSVEVVCGSEGGRRRLISWGVLEPRCHVIEPGIEPATFAVRPSPSLRHALGFDQSDRVMLLPGESTRASGHAEALWAAAILHVLDPKYKVLVWGSGQAVDALQHFATSQRHAERFLYVANHRLGGRVEFAELLGAADFVLATPTGPAPELSVAMAMAAGLPVVGTCAIPWLEDGKNALVAGRGARALARRVLDLEGYPGISDIVERARRMVEEKCSLARFVHRHQALCARNGVRRGEPVGA